MKSTEVAVKLTAHQALFLVRLLEGTWGSSDDMSVSQDCDHIIRRILRGLDDHSEGKR